MPIKCSFLVLNFKALDYTINCIRSIFQFEPDADVFFLDNGSNDDSFDVIKNYFIDNPLFNSFKSSSNLGVAGGRNYLLNKYLTQNTTSQICIFIDNDARLDDTVSTRLSTILSNKQIGVVGQTGCVIDRNFNYIWMDEAMEVDVIAGYFAAFRRELLLKIGTLDTVFEAYLYGGEDFDFCLRAKAAGYQVIIDPVLPVFHHGRISSTLLGDRLQDYINRTDMVLFQKWNSFKHLFEIHKNPGLMRQVFEENRPSQSNE